MNHIEWAEKRIGEWIIEFINTDGSVISRHPADDPGPLAEGAIIRMAEGTFRRLAKFRGDLPQQKLSNVLLRVSKVEVDLIERSGDGKLTAFGITTLIVLETDGN